MPLGRVSGLKHGALRPPVGVGDRARELVGAEKGDEPPSGRSPRDERGLECSGGGARSVGRAALYDRGAMA